MKMLEIIEQFGKPAYIIENGYNFSIEDINFINDDTNFDKISENFVKNCDDYSQIICQRIYESDNKKIVYLK